MRQKILLAILLAVLFVIVSAILYHVDWRRTEFYVDGVLFLEKAKRFVSRTDDNLRQKDTKVVFEEACNLLENWGGDSEKLNTAYNYLIEVITRDPKFAEAYAKMVNFHVAKSYIKGNQYDLRELVHGEPWLKKAAKLAPDAAFVDGAYASMHFSKNEYDTALQFAKKASQKEPENVKWYFSQARSYEAKTMYTEAIKEYNEALKYAKDDIYKASIYGKLGNTYDKAGDFDNASLSFEESLRFNPDSAWTYNNYAGTLNNAFYKSSKWKNEKTLDKAIDLVTKAISIMDFGVAHHTLAVSYVYKGSFLLNKGNLSEAKIYFKKSIDEDDSIAYTHYLLGTLYEQEGDLANAENEYLIALKLKSDYADAKNRLKKLKENRTLGQSR